MPNYLRHLISAEVGTSAFLGTLLDPEFDDPPIVQARAAIASVLKKHGIGVTAAAPTVVKLEYLNIDLVMAWAPWVILVENKVASASVTRGQLNDYYAAALREVEHNGFLKDAAEEIPERPICFIYLTPTPHTGQVEFESLTLDVNRTDIKKHIAWSEVLEKLIPLTGKGDGTASSFLDSGIERVRAVLEAAKDSQLPEDDRRSGMQAVLNQLKVRLEDTTRGSGLTFHRWSDRLREQLFASGPTRSAYVGIYLSYDASDVPTPVSIRAVGDISFDVASKHRVRLRPFLAAKTAEKWSAALGIPPSQIVFDPEKGYVRWSFAMPEMATEEFLVFAARRVSDFASVFAKGLVESL